MEIAVPAPDVLGRLKKRLIAEFGLAVEEWARYVPILTKWEDEHLLDNPTAEALAAHKRMVERLLDFGRFISLVTEWQEFPDRRTSEMAAAAQSAFEDKLLMWHRPRISEEEADKILAACFPDESRSAHDERESTERKLRVAQGLSS